MEAMAPQNLWRSDPNSVRFSKRAPHNGTDPSHFSCRFNQAEHHSTSLRALRRIGKQEILSCQLVFLFFYVLFRVQSRVQLRVIYTLHIEHPSDKYNVQLVWNPLKTKKKIANRCVINDSLYGGEEGI